jgi:cytidine deaminase
VKNAGKTAGYNHYRPNINQSIHAEEMAINNYLQKLYKKKRREIRKTVDILVIRIGANGNLLNSKPCKHCVLMMMNVNQLNIKNIYYSDDNGIIQCEKLNKLFQNIDNLSVSRGNL